MRLFGRGGLSLRRTYRGEHPRRAELDLHKSQFTYARYTAVGWVSVAETATMLAATSVEDYGCARYFNKHKGPQQMKRSWIPEKEVTSTKIEKNTCLLESRKS